MKVFMGALTYNARLLLSPEDKRKMLDVLEAHRFAYNEASKIKFGIESNSIVELHGAFYREFRTKYFHVPSQVVIRAEQEVLSAYRSIKSNKHNILAPVLKKKLSMRLDKRIYSFKKGIFSLISLGGRIKCGFYSYPKLQEYMDKYSFCDPLLFERHGDVWISLTFRTPELLPKGESACGIDLGIRMAAVTSEGKFYQDKKFNKEKRKLRYLKRCLQSKGTKKAVKHLNALKRKERNKNRNQTHLLGNSILRDTKADVLVLEDLKGLKKKKSPHQNKNKISQVPFFELKRVLCYKAQEKGKRLISVNPHFTSQIDHRTGLKDGLRKGRRYYCKDGVVLDADQNAAVNIALRSKHPVSYLTVLDGQASISKPYAENRK